MFGRRNRGAALGVPVGDSASRRVSRNARLVRVVCRAVAVVAAGAVGLGGVSPALALAAPAQVNLASPTVGVARVAVGDHMERRFFTSVFGGAQFTSTMAGTMYYRYGGDEPAGGEALAGEGVGTAPAVVGVNTVPAHVDESLAAGESLKAYVAVKGEGGVFSDVTELTFGAYEGDANWFALPGDSASALVTQTVQPDGIHYRLTGLTGDLAALNDQSLSLGAAPVELGAGFSGTHTFTVDGNSVAETAVSLRLNGVQLTGPAASPAVALAGGAAVRIDIDGTNTLTAGTSHAGLAVATGTHATLTSSTTGKLTATGASHGAGIGGWSGKAAGQITIGGNVDVTAKGTTGAGIGGGTGGIVCETIDIGGQATVNATSASGAGIGASYIGKAGLIVIGGQAKVTATSTGSYGAGIGGSGSHDSGTVSIGGQATVIATAELGAGIGSGAGYSGVSVWIGGQATVTAKASSASGIGAGQGYGAAGTITITDSAN
ncbi:MAG: hypothetical protein LBJ08_09995, partial [Bifidobacteriaceae bacterium]|nr:hypothetical protein [Bifidobacteriaceae bacterium]